MGFSNFDFDAALRAIPDMSACASPIEDIFYADIQKRLVPSAVVLRQSKWQTPIGSFYLDFLIEIGRRRVAFECDGKAFHQPDRDSRRDRAIVDAGHVHRIYRLRGYDIVYHLHDALDLVRARDGWLFSERGHNNIMALATRCGEHRDESGPLASGFPFAAVRWYERATNSEEYYGDDYYADLPLDEHLLRPTVLFWTECGPAQQ
jgi:very-short-patch-repair endonuclease